MRRQKYTGRSTAKIDVRLTPALKSTLTAAARAEGVTLGRWIVERLSASLMRCECAWCGAVIREGSPGAETTHTICEGCYHVELGKFLTGR